MKWIDLDQNLFMKYLHNQNKIDPLEESKVFIFKDKTEFEDLVYEEIDSKEQAKYISFSSYNPKIVFVFCGQGPQHINMGFDLMSDYPIFKYTILRCDELWFDLTGESFINKYELFLDKFKDKDRQNIPINDPLIAQPAIFFYQVGLIELYKYFNIIPDSVIGHSAGELSSFYASGA